MRVLFCNPPTGDGTAFVREGRCEHEAAAFQYLMPPISLASCAAVLRERGHEVALLDCVAESITPAALTERVRRQAPDMVVLAFSTPTFDSDAEISRALAAASPHAHLTAIGVHVTALPGESLTSSALHSVVRGEPELTVAELADALASGTSLADVAGLSARALDSVVHAPDRPPVADLDQLPFPARDLLPNDRYLAPLSTRTMTLLVPARGCPYRCGYCTAASYYGHALRNRSAASVVAEMAQCVTQHGIGEILMWADTFTADRGFVLAVCREIRQQGLAIPWICNARTDTVDAELLAEMRAAGCYAIAFGVESGSQAVLDASRKGVRVEAAVEAVRLAREAGLVTLAHIVVGLPGESTATVAETRSFLTRLDPDYIQVYCAVPFPGSDLYALASEKGWLPVAPWSSYDQSLALLELPGFSARQAAESRRALLRGFYLRPSYLVRQLSQVRSAGQLRRLVSGGFDFLTHWVGRR